jgi:uncharacterized membrane protein YdjX (TVP38/TMEM64 family)
MPSATANRRPLLLKALLAALVLAAGAMLVLRGVDLRALLDHTLELLRSAGPVVYFGAMAVLPALGVPASVFVIPAVGIFGPQFGTVPAVLLALGALTVNFCLAYLLARRALRPLLTALVTRLGYKLPEVESGDATDLMIMLRVTPGVPFFIQNYLAGLAEIPFGRYFVVSLLIVWPLNAAFLLFGDAILHGKGKIALLSLSGIIALTALLHLVRRHYERRRKAV